MARPSVSKTLFSQRLTAVREAVGFKERKAFAQKLGMNAETLGGYERGDAQPDYEFVVMYKKEFSVNIDWLITGEGEMFDGPRSVAPPANSRANLDQPDFIRLPMYDGVHASAGAGVTPTSEHSSAVLAFERQFLRERGAIPDSCTVIKARGDSMTPTIPDGSLLVVDHSQREVANGYITVVGVGDDLLVKRIRRRLDGMVELISDNAAYAPEVIAADRLEQLRIVGRVIYFCRVP